jgi:hypothetical protein
MGSKGGTIRALYAEDHRSVQFPSPPFGRLGSVAGLDRPFEMLWRELPKWNCTAETHFERADFSRAMGRKPRNHYNVSQPDSSTSQPLK